MIIEKATITDTKDLTELTIRSKSHWNYGEVQIEEWRAELTISEKYIKENLIYKLEIDKLLIGLGCNRPIHFKQKKPLNRFKSIH